ncbi:hypothetical protein [Lyngbya aestuarii]|uniref:hypothetical protein n=1 Tax=Lyngbya aestuarii TaxID=118322 RepID=UPI00403D58D5
MPGRAFLQLTGNGILPLFELAVADQLFSSISAVGVTDQNGNNWEAGRFEPRLTISQMQALCRILQCCLDELPSFSDG